MELKLEDDINPLSTFQPSATICTQYAFDVGIQC